MRFKGHESQYLEQKKHIKRLHSLKNAVKDSIILHKYFMLMKNAHYGARLSGQCSAYS